MGEARHIPQTMDEAVELLLARLGPEERAWLRAIPEPDLDDETWGLAESLRMEFGLWEGLSPLVWGDDEDEDWAEWEAPHPDDVSAEIVFQVWKRLSDDAVPNPPKR